MEGRRKALLRLALVSCAFGLAMAWFMYAFDASTEAFGFDESLPFTFKQSAKLATAAVLLLYPAVSKQRISGKVSIAATTLSAVLCVVALTAASAFEGSELALLIAGGAFCGLAFSLPLASWISGGIGRSFAWLFLSVSLGAIVTGILSCTFYLLPDPVSWWLAAAMPLCSISLFVWLGRSQDDAGLLPDASRPHASLLYFVGFLLGGGLVWPIFLNNWMPDVELSWLWFFVPCGLGSCAIVVGSAKGRIPSEIVYSLLVGISCIVSLLALSPLFQNAVFYSAMFMSAWFLLLFALAGSVWYGSAYRDGALRAACTSVASIYLAQFAMHFVMLHFSRHDFVLLVAAVVLLALSLVILLIAQAKSLASRRQDGRRDAAAEEDERLEGIVEAYALTEREGDVMRLLAKGNSVKGIAEKLVVSENTVKFHRGNIYQKLGINSRQSLIDMIAASDEGR